MFKKLMRSAGATVLAGGLLASGAMVAAPAQAAPVAPSAVSAKLTAALPLGIKGVVANYKAITVSSGGCRYNDFGFQSPWNTGDVVSYSGSSEVYRGKSKIATVKLDSNLRGTVKICPKVNAQRYGAFSVGGTTFKVVLAVRNANNQWDGKTTKTVTWRDNHWAAFTVKGAIDGNLYGKRVGSKKTFTTTLRYFSDKSQKWVSYNAGGAKLQYKSGSSWKNLKSLKFKSGKASYVQRTSKKYSYRVTVPGTAWVNGGTTKSFTL